ncbi:hypothetical protein LMG28688_07195 [Paraburkholderia caffeinitolerans]|uniref:Uncharacterized protein n=1 Tax=Paraburkholderia caffeinitolerans TaxID=1723730 RepID=A0A6J5H3P8_9BURK|nr:hypothetical protein LMG28688_07195 [Paraburkholderia caffeinitolerans]
MSNPASIFSLSKIGAIATCAPAVSRLIPATASSTLWPVSCCCFASSVMRIAPPLIALFVVDAASPDAPSATGGAIVTPPAEGSVVPGTGFTLVAVPPCVLPISPP